MSNADIFSRIDALFEQQRAGDVTLHELGQAVEGHVNALEGVEYRDAIIVRDSAYDLKHQAQLKIQPYTQGDTWDHEYYDEVREGQAFNELKKAVAHIRKQLES